MDQRDGGGDPNEQFHRNEAISAVVDEGFLGEDDDEDYEDLYNDVNVGEGFLQSVKKNEDQVENKVELVDDGVKVESKDDVFSRVEVGFDVKLDGNEMVEKGSGEGRVDLGQSLVKDEVESRTEGNDGVPKIGMGQQQQQQQSHLVGNGVGDGLSRQGSANVNANANVNGSGGNVYGNGGGGGMNVAGGGNGGGMNIGGGGGGGGGTGTGTVLFVGDLHWWTTDAELESELCKYGQVKEVKFFDEKASGKSKGYCQVEFYDPSAAIACKEGMNGHVFNGRPCVVAFASPYSVKRMGEAQVNRNQQLAQSSAGQVKRGPGDVPGKPGGVGNMPAGGNFQGGGDNNNNNNNRGYGRGNWGRGNGQGMAGRGGRGGRGMMGNGGNGFGPPHMMHPQSMMGQGFDPSFGGPMGRMGGYGGFPGGPTPPFSGMMPSFPPVGNVGLPGLAPHVNPAFFGRGMPMNGMGMMPAGGADGNMGMWSDPNMSGWNGDEHGGRVGESSYGEEAASDQQFGEGSHDRGDWPNPAKEKDRRHRDDRDREVGYERDLPREKGVHEEEWPERRHRDERERERSRDRDRDRERERSRDRDRDRDRERSRDRDRGRDRHRDERDRYADHHRYRDVEPEYDDEWDRGRSSRGHGKSRLAPEDEHRSRSRDADYGKKRRVTAE